MGFRILKFQMSKTFTLCIIYFRRTVPSDWRCSIIPYKIANPTPRPFSRRLEMFLCQSSGRRVPFWGRKRERNGFRISYSLSNIHWASDLPPPPPPPPLITTRICRKPLLLSPAGDVIHVPLHTAIQYYSAIFFI